MKKLFTFFAALGIALTMQAANIAVSGLQYCDAIYWTYELEDGSTMAFYDLDLYVDYDNDNGNYVYPEVYVQVPANSKTALNGTYEVWYAGYWKSANDSVESDLNATEAVGSITFKNVDSEGNYEVTLSFTAADGNTYTANETVEVWAFDYDNDKEITLNEGGSAPAGDMLTCAEAAQIAAENGYKGTTEVTVYGYVTELINDKVDNNGNQKQSFWMADTENGGKQFEAYYAFVPSKFAVGDRVSVTGILQNYNGTIEIADGQAALMEEGEGGSTDPDEPNTGDMLTCAEAAQIAATEGYKGMSDVTVYGYVTELINDKVDNNGNQKQSFWMADTENGGKQFEAYWAFVPEKFAVGDRVSVTGILQNYNGTIEIADGQAARMNEGGSTDPDEPGTDGALYQIDFKTDITGWTIDDKDLGGLTYVWKQDDRYGMKASAYNQQAYAAESWLISSTIDLSNAKAPSLVITQALNKGTGANLAVKVSTDNGTSWTDLSINMPAGTSWDFQEDHASLAAYAGKKIQIAFAYKSTTSDCPTWEIGTVTVLAEGGMGLQQTREEGSATKVLRSGQVYILRGGKAYTVLGARAE